MGSRADFELEEPTDPGELPAATSPAQTSAEGHVQCTFSFRCPRLWTQLARTSDPGVRYCFECEKDVHLVDSQAAYDAHARRGDCVAVRVEGAGEDDYLVGDIG